MKDDKKPSILKDALTDYNAIKEAADANAKKKLADEFPEKFNSLLKEELQNKNKKTKESYKKLDNVEESEEDESNLNNEESVMKNQEKETKKVEETAGKGKPFEKAAQKVAKVEEDVKITDTVGKPDPFTEKAKGNKKVEETAGEGKPFNEKTKKPLQKVTEEFDITELNVHDAGMALEGVEDDDEIFIDDDGDDDVIGMEDIEKEISEMEELRDINQDSPSYMEKDNKGIAFNQLVGLKNQLDEILNGMNMEEMHAAGGERYGTKSQISRQHADSSPHIDNKLIDEIGMDEMHAKGDEQRFGSHDQVAKLHQGNPLIDEEDDDEISIDDVNSVLGSEQPVDETIASNLSNMRHQTAQIPGNEYKPSGAVNKKRPEMRESNMKIGSLIEENKKLTKKLNETKKYKQSASTLIEQYKSALEKYRNQLKEMATFNTNLAHVNNLLVNESLALTQEDKIRIINEFKRVDSISESQKKYKTILTEMKGSKKTLTENIENKVSASIQPSSKQKLDEVVEKTAYANNEHLNRMKNVINYVENRGKKK